MLSLDDLAARAREAAAHAYAPYSSFPVGAALQGADGAVYTGVNVENASYGLTVCAERNAAARMVAAGCRELRAVAVYAAAAPEAPNCCGACRQVLVEFAPDPGAVPVVLTGQGASRETNLGELLPEPFRLSTDGE